MPNIIGNIEFHNVVFRYPTRPDVPVRLRIKRLKIVFYLRKIIEKCHNEEYDENIVKPARVTTSI